MSFSKLLYLYCFSYAYSIERYINFPPQLQIFLFFLYVNIWLVDLDLLVKILFPSLLATWDAPLSLVMLLALQILASVTRMVIPVSLGSSYTVAHLLPVFYLQHLVPIYLICTSCKKKTAFIQSDNLSFFNKSIFKKSFNLKWLLLSKFQSTYLVFDLHVLVYFFCLS